MAAAVMAVPPPLPPLSADEASRLALDCRARVWRLRVWGLARRLLSLGRSYEVRYRLSQSLPPTAAAHMPPHSLLSLLGFNVTSLMDTHVLHVSAVGPARVPFHVVGGVHNGVQVDDYLVGLDERDLLVAPLSHVRKLADAAATSETEKVLVLRFVRLERLVATDHARSHGHVLEVLRLILAQHAELVHEYTALLARNRTIVTRELARDKKLLAYVRILAAETQQTVLKDDKFHFADNFLQWYTALDDMDDDSDDMNDNDKDSDDHDDRRAAAQEETSADYFEISDDDETDVVDLTADAHTTTTAQASRPSHGQSQATVQRPLPVRPGVGATGPTRRDADKPTRKPSTPAAIRDLDMSWTSVFATADLKWLPQAQPLLRNFVSGVLDSFEQDDAVAAHPRVLTVATSIAEQLVRQYIRKRYALSIPNSVLHKDFARHVRMLRSNLGNPKNHKLRADLLDGALATARLCEMTVDELAPEALRLERERRFEQHAQSNMLKEPTGPTLVKTKHGYKEVNFGSFPSGSQETDTPVTESLAPEAETSRSSAEASNEQGVEDDDMAAAPFDYEPPSSGATEASDVRAQRSSPPVLPAPSASSATPVLKKRVSFAQVLETSAPAPTFETEEATRRETTAADEIERRKQRARKRPVNATAGRAFLLTLLDPTYDLSESLRMFVETLKDAPLASMSREFVLTTDVKLFRDSRANDNFVFNARLQLAHLVVEGANSDERHANIDAAYKLMAALEHFKRRFFDLLDQIHQNFGFGGATADSRQVRDHVFNFLVHENMVKFIVPPPHQYEENGVKVEAYDAQVYLYELLVASSRHTNLPIARHEASQEMLSFVAEAVARKAKYITALPPPTPASNHQPAPYQRQQEQQVPRSVAPPPQSETDASWDRGYPTDRPSSGRDDQAGYRGHSETRSADASRYYRDRDADEMWDPNSGYRKRRYEPSREGWTDEPSMARRRMDEAGASSSSSSMAAPSRVVDAKPSQPTNGSYPPSSTTAAMAEESAPLVFYVDSKGEQKPHADREMKALTMEQRIQAEVDGYQELVAQMFGDRDRVMAQLDNIMWDARRETECIMFNDKLNVTRVVRWDDAARAYVCELQAFGKRIVATSLDSHVDAGGRKATSELKRIIDLHYAHWKVLVRTYSDRKKQTPTTLMAANETRAKNQQYVDLKENRAMHMYECCILVDNHLAIRHACLNQKMAKRSASEEFRDVLDSFLKIEEKRKAEEVSSQRHAPTNAATRSTGAPLPTQARTSAGNASTQLRSEPAPRARASNLVLCSDDEADDDDDYGSDDDSGSEYGGGVSTGMKSDKSQAEAVAAASLKTLLDHEKALPYDVSSETTLADDARFRATVRSLFTLEDKLCTGIEQLQGALKYRGSSESEMVPNVRASIQIERLREGVFEVRVAVNDAVHFVASAVTKADACNAAISGMLHKLQSLRAVWVQLLNFFHTKVLGVNDIMESFHLLRLANITSITGSLETPPPPRGRDYNHRAQPVPGVHCALRVGEHVAYRVVGVTEDDARLLADCRTAKFIMDLINDGLVPETQDGDDDTKMLVDDGDDVARSDAGDGAGGRKQPSWSCQLRISDSVEDTVTYEYRVHGTWQQEKVPSASEFVAEDIVVTQVGKVPIEQLEKNLKDWHGSVVTYFSLESTHEQWKLVRHISAYGHKSRASAFALKLEISPATRYEVYLIPPGASINSAENLYWPKKVLPRDLADRKEIYGLLKVRHL